MPIQSRDDAVEVEERIRPVFAASSDQRVAEVRGLFVEVLDFNAASGQVSLAGATGNVHLPDAAHYCETSRETSNIETWPSYNSWTDNSWSPPSTGPGA